MTDLRVVLYLAAQFVTILPRHHHVAQDHVGLLLGNGLQGTIGIKARTYPIGLSKQRLQITHNLYIVIDHKDRWTLVLVINILLFDNGISRHIAFSIW